METPTFLYKPNFCAECGERIEREDWHFWTSRSLCENCEPVFRANRLVPAAFLCVIVFVAGMFFGQMGQKLQSAVPVVSTQSAAGMEKPQSAAFKQPVAADRQSQDTAVNQAPPQNFLPAKQPAVNKLSAPEIPTVVYTCGARTQKGTPCSRRVKAAGTRCWQHLGKPSMLESRENGK